MFLSGGCHFLSGYHHEVIGIAITMRYCTSLGKKRLNELLKKAKFAAKV